MHMCSFFWGLSRCHWYRLFFIISIQVVVFLLCLGVVIVGVGVARVQVCHCSPRDYCRCIYDGVLVEVSRCRSFYCTGVVSGAVVIVVLALAVEIGAVVVFVLSFSFSLLWSSWGTMDIIVAIVFVSFVCQSSCLRCSFLQKPQTLYTYNCVAIHLRSGKTLPWHSKTPGILGILANLV